MDETPENKSPARLSKRKMSAFFVCGIAGLTLLFLPGLIAATPLRNLVAAHFLNKNGFEGSIGNASAGWFTPVSAQDAKANKTDETLGFSVASMRTEFSTLDLLSSAPDLGTIHLSRPHLELKFGRDRESSDDADEHAELSNRQKATFTAEIDSGRLTLSSDQVDVPAIVIDDLSLGVQVRNSPTGRVISIDKTLVFDREPLTPETCNAGLQLVAPLLADSATIEGEFSIELLGFQRPLDEPDPHRRQNATHLAGRLQLHSVQTSLKNPILEQIALIFGRLTGRGQPELVRIVDDSWIEFELRDGRIFHEGLVLVLPQVSEDFTLSSSGFVGLDESIDLTVQMRFPESLTSPIPFLRRLTNAPIELQVTGTLKKPRIKFPGGRDLLEELAGRLRNPGENDSPQSLEGAVGNIIQGLTSEKAETSQAEDTAGGILDLIQAIRDRKRERPKKSEPSEELGTNR